MFNLHTAFATQLLALIAAAALLAWTGYAHVHAQKLVRAVAYTGMVLAVLGMLCTGYYGLKYTRQGYFRTPAGMMHGMHGMPRGGMMMPGKMNGGETGTADEAHDAAGADGSSDGNPSH